VSDIPELNTALFAQVLEQLEAHPELHEQADFENFNAVCGTTRCVAGWAIYLDAVNKGERIHSYRDAESTDRGRLAPSQTARKLLGLTFLEAEELFFCSSNEEAVERVRECASGRRFGVQEDEG
jgi:hypothetical protein